MSALAPVGPGRAGMVRRAEPADIPEVARIHVQAFPKSFLTALGRPFLQVYYRLVSSDPGGIFLVHENSTGIDGFAAGFLQPLEFYRRMKDARWTILRCLLLAVGRRPWVARRILYHVRQMMLGKRREHSNECELSSIGVAPQASHRGIGTALVQTFLDTAWSHGASCVYLTTDAVGNAEVESFYRRLGFELRGDFSQYSGRRMNEYALRRDKR
ncbi:MAG TPA: GNAT family N-acetyltransferase [Bryobacteraceae bacterium]|nr:GNAT family N-acetyltransferase [Bryobacteraceae bacterium]